MKTTAASAALGALAPAHASAEAPPQPALQRVEPPSWWVGMAEPQLQLMLHGPGLAALHVRMSAPGVRLLGQQRLSSPNYLFVDLELAADCRPGRIDIQLHHPGHDTPLLNLSYELQAREPGSAQRQGFDTRDAVYLLVPDRFARAEPAVAPPAMRESRVQRSQPGARHGGNLAGLREHLGYIADMGFTQIWPTPVVENDNPSYSYHGYAATDFYRVDPRLGSNEEYRALAVQARQQGLGLIQDIVLNHIGDHHWWMADLPTPEWLNQWPSYTETHHARVTWQDPHAAPSDQRRFSQGWFTPNMPDLNQRQPQLATYLIQMSLWWIEYAGLSGLRTDTYSYSDRDFLSRWSARLMREYPRLNIVGEEWSGHPAIVAYWQRGKRNHDGYVSSTPSMLDFPLHYALIAGLKEADQGEGGIYKLYEALAQDFLYADANRLMAFEGNHDTPRLYSQLNEDLDLLRMAWGYLCVVNRIPQFLYGSELLLTSPGQRDDGQVRADFPGGFAGDRVDGLRGRGLSPRQRTAQALLRQLLNWRRQTRLVHEGRLTHYAPLQGVYVLLRHWGAPGSAEARQGERVMLVLNKQNQDVALDLRRFADVLGPGDRAHDVLQGGAARELGRTLTLAARSTTLLQLAAR
ncbi:glycoside hydrolase family 13 protein [Roseateles sp. BYS180W]|uniref:Glycoside hydrolase family 13 protein n=1 Tax=Roseateles rivi TaxID=3299028 RepID=A0ABW7FS35_9BURK